jgi:hypothetical protein
MYWNQCGQIHHGGIKLMGDFDDILGPDKDEEKEIDFDDILEPYKEQYETTRSLNDRIMEAYEKVKDREKEDAEEMKKQEMKEMWEASEKNEKNV